ncbi:MAG TPA: hypothetical protein VMB80_09685 [Candidatus Acidoferrum sp.]|nr:hypothetical protein [Candidatus Acidoferrum sp.]
MVNIKIICGCGQKYSFDVYPLNGRMPAPVQCPVCGMDGTAAANDIMARTLGIQPALPPPAPPPAPAPVLKLRRSGGYGSQNEELPDVVKDAWKWCRDMVHDLRSSPAVQTSGGRPMTAEEIWRQRALEAERRAQEAVAAARADLAPHLAQALKEALVQELAVQRKELLQAQQIAIAEIAQLSQHLDELKAPMQERLRSYETRIQELEKELAARSEENRVLLQLKIEMVRHQLELERTRSRVSFN